MQRNNKMRAEAVSNPLLPNNDATATEENNKVAIAILPESMNGGTNQKEVAATTNDEKQWERATCNVQGCANIVLREGYSCKACIKQNMKRMHVCIVCIMKGCTNSVKDGAAHCEGSNCPRRRKRGKEDNRDGASAEGAADRDVNDDQGQKEKPMYTKRQRLTMTAAMLKHEDLKGFLRLREAVSCCFYHAFYLP